MPESDLSLLIDAARAAGHIATRFWQQSPETWEKDAGAGPVTEADLAVNDMLRSRLGQARPDYGWLSEETEDATARLGCENIFIIDPIDGTRAFIAGERSWAHSLAIARNGRIVAGVVFLPLMDKLYQASLGQGAYLNGERIRPGAPKTLGDATVLSARENFQASYWINDPPPVRRRFRPSLAYRVALVAEGRFDAMLTLRNTWEWDIAAGCLIAQEAGARVTDANGARPKFNNPIPTVGGLIAGTEQLHGELYRRLAWKPEPQADA